jgi:hypothetical protein
MVVGRGSFVVAFPLFGLEIEDYDGVILPSLLRRASYSLYSAEGTRQRYIVHALDAAANSWCSMGGFANVFIPVWCTLLPRFTH